MLIGLIIFKSKAFDSKALMENRNFRFMPIGSSDLMRRRNGQVLKKQQSCNSTRGLVHEIHAPGLGSLDLGSDQGWICGVTRGVIRAPHWHPSCLAWCHTLTVPTPPPLLPLASLCGATSGAIWGVPSWTRLGWPGSYGLGQLLHWASATLWSVCVIATHHSASCSAAWPTCIFGLYR